MSQSKGGLMTNRLIAWLAVILLGFGPLRASADVEVGKVVAPFDTTLIDGKTVKSADIKGKVVLAVFWATWCPYCRKEMPDIEALNAKLKQQGLQVLALSLDADSFAVESYLKDNDFSFPVAMRSPAHQEVFGRIAATPTHVLLDRGGVVRLKQTGVISRERLESRIADLLAAK
jgi:peroxiredoxin